MRKAIVALMLLGLALPVRASDGDGQGDGDGHGNQGAVGPQGPAGPQGQAGSNGQNGSNGANGSNGVNGSNGRDGVSGRNAETPASRLLGELDVRLLDTEYTQVVAFDAYHFNDGHGQDLLMDGGNAFYGVKLVVKLGKSYEETLLERQARQIQALEEALSLKK